MSKQDEREYLRRRGEETARHASGKPFSDPLCGEYLVEFGAVFGLLPSPPAQVLDLGCGPGWTSIFLARRGYDVFGIDIAEDMIDIAQQNAAKEDLPNLAFRVADFEEAADEGRFDAVLFFDALHHAEDEGKALSVAYRALKPGGICIAVEPGRGHAGNPVSREMAERFGVTEKDMPPRRIVRAGKKAGFRSFRTLPHARHVIKLTHGTGLRTAWRARRFRRLLGLGAVRAVGLAFLLAWHKRSDGTVVMVK